MPTELIVNRSRRALKPVWPERRGLRAPAVHRAARQGSNGNGSNRGQDRAARMMAVFQPTDRVVPFQNNEGVRQVTGDDQIVKQLRGVAARLTGDLELQKDLLQEMFIHLVRVEADQPGQTLSWYIQSCQFRAGKYLARGRSVDSIKRRENLVPLGQTDDDDIFCLCLDTADPIDLHSELITRDIVDLLVPQLTDVQQQILFLLMHGFGVREIARELRVSHPTIITQRKKIARAASALLADSGCIGSNGNSLVHSA